MTVDFSGREQVAAISAGISYCFSSHELVQIIAEGLAYFTGDKYLLITNINRANSMLRKLYFQETRRSWQAAIKVLLLFCILYLQIQLSDLHIISMKDHLGALSWGRDGKIGVLVCGLFFVGGWFFF